MSASRIATSDTSGRSRPSRRRLMPTSTSNSPWRRSRRISHPLDGLDVGVEVAHPHAEVLGSTRSGPRPCAWSGWSRARARRSRRARGSRRAGRRPGPSPGAPPRSGSMRPVGRMICSTTTPPRLLQLVGARRRGDVDHLAEPRLELLELERPVVERRRQAEAVLDQGLSCAERSPWYIPPIWGIVWCDSSTMMRKSVGK